MTDANKIRTIVFDDLKIVVIGIAVAAGIVVVFMSGLFLAFVSMLAGPDITTAEILSPNGVYIASIDMSSGGATAPSVHKIYVQSKGKTIFDPRVLVGTLVSAESIDHQPGAKLSWLSSSDLQVTYQRAKAAKLHTEIVVNGQKIRIYQNIGSKM